MDDRTILEFEVYSKYALFTEPLSRLGDEKITSMFPTYSALKGVVDNIYRKPTIKWAIDEVRVMNPIRMASKGLNHRMSDNKINPVNHTYLYKPRYQVRAHFEFNIDRPDLKEDYIIAKHAAIAKRALKNGGRFPITLGTTECVANVEPCVFGEDVSYYDDVEIQTAGLMLHSIRYPDTEHETDVISYFWHPKMKKGIIKFIRQEECEIFLNNGSIENFTKKYELGKNMRSVDDEYITYDQQEPMKD